MNKRLMSMRCGSRDIVDLVFREQPKRTVDEATPDDVRSRAAAEIERLKGEIASLTDRLAKAKAELKFWEGI